MSARNNRFNAALLSLEALCGEADPEKLPWLGDGGAGVARLVSDIDRDWPTGPDRRACLARAVRSLARAGKRHLVPTLRLIVRNGTDREKSIRALCRGGCAQTAARRRYERHRDLLLAHFDVASVCYIYRGHDASAAG